MSKKVSRTRVVSEPASQIDPNSSVMEFFKTIRTNIEFSSIDHKLRAVNITSSTQGEGKSMVLINLALSFAQIGRSVLIIDADLRRPSIHRSFGISNRRGLTSTLLGDETLSDNTHATAYPNLSILTAGPIPPNPAELLMSEAMTALIEEAKGLYDMVFIDCPPAGIITDAAIVATKVDGTLFVARSGVADKRLVKHAVDHLEHVQARVLGFVFNGVESETDGYYYQQYYYTQEPQETRRRTSQRRPVVRKPESQVSLLDRYDD